MQALNFSSLLFLVTIAAVDAFGGHSTRIAAENGILAFPGPDYRQAGAFETEHTEGVTKVSSGNCTMRYHRYTPMITKHKGSRVMLLHGFTRSGRNMANYAEHLASWGYEVIAPDLCFSTVQTADHVKNAKNAIELNAELGGGPVIYMGFSAGGISAFLVAADDENAVGNVGLDAVDTFNDAGKTGAVTKINSKTTLNEMGIFSYGLVSDPSSCNAFGNFFRQTYRDLETRAEAVSVVGTNHCDYESNSVYKACTALCARRSPVTVNDARPVVQGLFTAAVLALDGNNNAHKQWWESGGTYWDNINDTTFVLDPYDPAPI